METWKRAAAAALLVVSGGFAAIAAAAQEPVAVEAFAKRSEMSSPRLSPQGTYLAVSYDQGKGNHALVIYRVASMQQTALLRFPRYEMPYQVEWVSDTRLVIGKGRKQGRLEKPRPIGEVIASDYDGNNQKYIYGYEQATQAPGLPSRGFGYIDGLPQVPNGHFYLRQYSPDSRNSLLYDVDTARPSYHLLASIDQPDLDFVIDHQGVPRYAVGADLDDNLLVFRADARGNWSPVAEGAGGENWTPFALSADANRVYGWLNHNGGPTQLMVSDADGGNRKVLAADDFASVDDVQWDSASGAPFAARLADPTGTLYFDPGQPGAALHQTLVQALPGRRVDFINGSRDGRRQLLTISSDRDPGAWYLYDSDTRKLDRLITASPAIEPARMGRRQLRRFKASDGLELQAVLTLPPGVQEPRNLPMVLLPHGGPYSVEDDWTYDPDAQFLASRGYLVLQVNYRGSSGRGKAFEQSGYLKWGTRIQDDLIDGVRWAGAQGLADPGRVCVYGASFGGYSAMMAPARAPGMFKCAIGLAGVYDLPMMYAKGDIRSTESGRRYLARVIGRDDAELKANSPVAHAADIHVPVFLAHGKDDERAPFAQAKAMRAALTAAGNPPQWMEVADEGHGFYGEQNQVAFYQALEKFLADNLGPPDRH
ncbi:MAG: prolyl oligopeptidase family serine peptidase [Pseudoxanthomonas sp.]